MSRKRFLTSADSTDLCLPGDMSSPSTYMLLLEHLASPLETIICSHISPPPVDLSLKAKTSFLSLLYLCCPTQVLEHSSYSALTVREFFFTLSWKLLSGKSFLSPAQLLSSGAAQQLVSLLSVSSHSWQVSSLQYWRPSLICPEYIFYPG